jgi:hypothetical protein
MPAAESIKIWRIKTGQTASVILPVHAVGSLLLNHPEITDDLVRALGNDVVAAVRDITTSGLYERKGSGRSLERVKKPPSPGAPVSD